MMFWLKGKCYVPHRNISQVTASINNVCGSQGNMDDKSLTIKNN